MTGGAGRAAWSTKIGCSGMPLPRESISMAMSESLPRSESQAGSCPITEEVSGCTYRGCGRPGRRSRCHWSRAPLWKSKPCGACSSLGSVQAMRFRVEAPSRKWPKKS